MEIGGSLPFHIARAYGVAGRPPAPGAQDVNKPSQATPVAQPAQANGAAAQRLVAGSVSAPIDFDAPSLPSRPADGPTLQLYTRAADKIEAAVAVRVGRMLDVQG
jgi:hypothetical protein